MIRDGLPMGIAIALGLWVVGIASFLFLKWALS